MQLDLTSLVRFDRRVHKLCDMLRGSAVILVLAAWVLWFMGGHPTMQLAAKAFVVIAVAIVGVSFPIRKLRRWGLQLAGAVLFALVLWVGYIAWQISKDATLAYAFRSLGWLGQMWWAVLVPALALVATAWPFFEAKNHFLAAPGADAVRCLQHRNKLHPITRDPRKLATAGLLLAAPVAALIIALELVPRQHHLYVWLGSLIAFWAGGESARRRWQVSGDEIRKRDQRQPVLILRSFNDDSIKLEKPKWQRSRTEIAYTFEEMIALQMRVRGPVIAIGAPGEVLPKIGAARSYYTDDTWQEQAEQMVYDASHIVMFIGTTEGLGWEIRRIATKGMLHKLILVFPPVSEGQANMRWEAIAEQLGERRLREQLKFVVQTDLMMVAFEPEGNPFLLNCAERDPQAYRITLEAATQIVDTNHRMIDHVAKRVAA